MSFFDLFPPPHSMYLSMAGISISDRAIRFVSLKPLVYGEVPLQEGIVSAGAIVNKTALADALKTLRGRGISHASIAIPDDKAYLFTSKVESATRRDLADAVAFTIEENAPVKLASSIYSFETEDQDLEGDIATMAAVTVLPKDVAESYAEVFELAGIVPVSIDLESQARARALIARGDGRVELIVDLSERKASFHLVKSEMVRFSSSLTLDLSNQTDPSVLTTLKAEMRKVFLFSKDEKIEQIIVSGSLASNEAFIATLLGDIETPYSIGNAWVNVSAFKKKLPSMPFAESLVYAPAIGAALPSNPHSYV